MHQTADDRYFQMVGGRSVPGLVFSQENDTSHVGLGLHSGSREETFSSFAPDFSAFHNQEQMDDHRSYYAQSVCTQPSLGHDSVQRPPSVGDTAEDCLNFLPPMAQHTLLDEWSQPVDILLSAQLAGLFSREAQVLEIGPEDSTPAESINLICYRRNLISITGHVAIPTKLRLLETQQGQQLPIISQEIVLSVFESLDRGRGGRLIQSLRSGPPISAAAEADSDSPGPEPITLDPEKAEEATHDQEYIIFPFEWQRLQFRKATPNNGKSRDRQKFFFVSIKVLANLADGQKVSISEASSNPIIVRGRGPQNFVAKDSQKLGRSRSLNSTCEGRLKKPNRHSTRNSLLRQSLSRKARIDPSGSSDAIQRMSIDDLSELFKDAHAPMHEFQMERTPPRDTPATVATTSAAWNQLDLTRSASIPPGYETSPSADIAMVMDAGNSEAITWSPESLNEYHAHAFPNITSVSPQDIQKNAVNSPFHEASSHRSSAPRSSSVGAEQRFRPFLERQHASKEEPPRFVQNSVFQAFGTSSKMGGDTEMSMKPELPMSPPEDDHTRRRSASVSLPNTGFREGNLMEDKQIHPFPITPMSPPKESDLVAKSTVTPTTAAPTPGDATHHDPLPSPSTQFDIFESLLAPFSSVSGIDGYGPHHGKLMTPIAEGLENGPILGMGDNFESHSTPAASQPNSTPRIQRFAEQFDPKVAEQLEIVPIPPPTEQTRPEIRVGAEDLMFH